MGKPKKSIKTTNKEPIKDLKPLKKEPSFMLHFFVVTGIIVLGYYIFNTVTNFDFIVVWDDDWYVLNNEHIRQFNWTSIKKYFTSYYFANYHPLTTISYSINYYFSKLNPSNYHLTNLLFHFLNIIVVYVFAMKLTRKIYISAFVALIFAIHPMHVESVAWVSERKDVLYSFFFMISLVFYIDYINKVKKLKYYLLSFVFFLMSLLSKSAAVVLPLVFLAIDYFFSRKLDKKLILEKIPFFVLSLIFGLVAIYSQQVTDIENMPLNYNIPEIIVVPFYALLFYLLKFFVPIDSSVFHYYPLKTGDYLSVWYYLLPIVFVGLMIGLYQIKKYRREIIFGTMFFIITLIMVIQLIPIGSAITAERYTYIPYIGLSITIGIVLNSIMENKNNASSKYIPIIIVGIFTIWFTVLAKDGVKLWKNGITLFENVTKLNPNMELGFFNKAKAYEHYKDNEAALAGYNEAIKIRPDYPDALLNRGNIKQSLNDAQSALEDYQKAVKFVKEKDAAMLYNSIGFALGNLRRFDEAITNFNKAIKIDPNLAEAYNNRAISYASIGKFELAISDFNVALKFKPNNYVTYINRGMAKIKINDKKGACDDFYKSKSLGFAEADEQINRNCK